MLEGRKLEARRWIQQARHDLRAVAWNIEGGFHDTASFLARQSAEKAMFLYARSLTHHRMPTDNA
jgi:HEPN domain-containing protein